MKKPILALATMFGLLSASAEAEQQAPVLVELFTSQGCYSCPPADLVLAELAERGDVIALSYHITYWDRLGWPDTFGQAKFDDRQRLYARWLQARSIYTPQAVIAGEIDVVGSNDARMASAIDFVRREGRAQKVAIDAEGLASLPDIALETPIELWTAVYAKTETVAIERGENGGKTLDYHHIVKDWRSLGKWEGQGANIRLPFDEWR